MKNKRFVIMITDSKGSKHINISMFLRHIIPFSFIFIFTIVAFIYIAITVVQSAINDINLKNIAIKEEFTNIQYQNKLLNDEMNEKKEEMVLIGEKIEDLEDMAGISGDYINHNYSLLSRVNVASITTIQKSFIMKFIPNGYPIKHFVTISSPFGIRIHPIKGTRSLHTGVDLKAPIGTEIYAAADGVIEQANSNYNGGYGHLIKITHSFGFRTYYAHLSKVLAKRGEFVKKGQLIAYSGNTGASTGPHLHYEIRFLGEPINPKNFNEWNMLNFDDILKKERNIAWQSLLATINSLMERRVAQLQ